MSEYVRVIVSEGPCSGPHDLAPFGSRVSADQIWESLELGMVTPDQMLPTTDGQLVRVRHIARAFRYSAR